MQHGVSRVGICRLLKLSAERKQRTSGATAALPAGCVVGAGMAGGAFGEAAGVELAVKVWKNSTPSAGSSSTTVANAINARSRLDTMSVCQLANTLFQVQT